jgi:hypothetical protein
LELDDAPVVNEPEGVTETVENSDGAVEGVIKPVSLTALREKDTLALFDGDEAAIDKEGVGDWDVITSVLVALKSPLPVAAVEKDAPDAGVAVALITKVTVVVAVGEGTAEAVDDCVALPLGEAVALSVPLPVTLLVALLHALPLGVGD